MKGAEVVGCCPNLLTERRIKELAIELRHLLSDSSSVDKQALEMVKCLVETAKAQVCISQISSEHVILRISGCCRKTSKSNILVFQKKNHFVTVHLFNGGSTVGCVVKFRSLDSDSCLSIREYRGKIVRKKAVYAFKGLLALARDLAGLNQEFLAQAGCG